MGDSNIIALMMPKWGMAMASGKVVDWLVDEGTQISVGEELLEIETEKTVNVLEAIDTGTLSRITAQSGDELPVGALLGVITQGGVSSKSVEAFILEFQERFVPEEVSEEVDTAPLNADVDGLSIAYRKYEAKNDQGKLPLLFIHGFGGNQDGWMYHAAELSENRTVYTIDLPGHGASEKEVADGTLPNLAKAVYGLMETVLEPRVHVVGHSLGAAVAVELAIQFPYQVASLTLISGAGAGTSVDKQYIEGFISANRRKQLKPYMQQLFVNSELATRSMVEDMLDAKRIEGVEECLRKISDAAIISLGDVDIRGNLTRLTMPIQIIWGKEDRVASIVEAKNLPASIENIIVDDAGHMVHIEAARKVNNLIAEFIKSV